MTAEAFGIPAKGPGVPAPGCNDNFIGNAGSDRSADADGFTLCVLEGTRQPPLCTSAALCSARGFGRCLHTCTDSAQLSVRVQSMSAVSHHRQVVRALNH